MQIKILTIAILSFLVQTSIAQFYENKNEPSPRVMTVRSKTEITRFCAISKPKTDKEIHPELTYYWYYSNQIHQSSGNYSGKVLHGDFVSYFTGSNNLKEKGKFKTGLKNGVWMEWHETGKIQTIKTWDNGLIDGTVYEYNPDGSTKNITTYKKGKLHGKSIIYQNNEVKEVIKFKNGEEIKPKEKKVKDPELDAKKEEKKSKKAQAKAERKKKKEDAKLNQPEKKESSNWFEKMFAKKSDSIPTNNK